MKLSLFLFLVLLMNSAISASFSFENSFDGWGNWGDGLGFHDPEIGHGGKGSLKLSTDFGETQTVHYQFKNLKPGLYKVVAYVRSSGVLSSRDGTSFWHFFDSGKGTENVFTELNGSYEWRKIEYSISVSKTELLLWFRLKSPGEVWIDDVSVEPTSISTTLTIEPARAFIAKKEPITKTRIKKQIVLLDFDKAGPNHPFSTTTVDQQKSGRFSSHKYYNLDPSQYLSANWSQFDRIELDVYNGNKEYIEFYLTLADDLTTDYWSQVNHKTHLSPGWNHLNFSLTQFLGERGSHRFQRSLHLSKIKKWFIVADHSEKFKASPNFYVDNIKLSYEPAPSATGSIRAFDFTSQKDQTDSGLKKVTTKDTFSSDKGYGFVAPNFWRVEDAQWIGQPLRYTIGILDGHFKVALPNGKYSMSLNIERLGFWDVSFWKDRMVSVNGKPVFKETRSFGKDFLKDWLQFEKIVPSSSDHPFDLYLKNLLAPIEVSFQVTNGEVDIEFDADQTGISLNSLIIWEAKDKSVAKEFLSNINQRLKIEFDWMARPLNGPSKKLPAQLISVIDPTLSLRPNETHSELAQNLHFLGGAGEKSSQVIQVRGQGELSWKLTELNSEQGKKISPKSLIFSEVIPQYISPDLNHETYIVAGKYLRETTQSRIDLDGTSTTYLWIDLKVMSGVEPGLYQGEVLFNLGNSITKMPIQIRVMNYQLSDLDFPVGFFGPDPITPSYFTGIGLEKIRTEYRLKAIKLLGEAGFTTLTGLPGATLKTDGDWSLDTSAIDETLSAANRAGMSKVYFSYGGKFPQQFFDGALIPSGMSEDKFLDKISPLLSRYIEKPGMPRIVHTFSDEAAGYSDKVKDDLQKAKKIKDKFPFLYKGGFGSRNNPATQELNKYFNYGFYSNISKIQMRSMDRNNKWGGYNAAPGNLDDPRFSFGPGLFYAYKNGLSHCLEWHSSAVNNYPYYDLDGRESDVVMFMPTSDGQLRSTIRFEMATEGLHLLRKLILLDKALQKNKSSDLSKAKLWLEQISKGSLSSSENIFKPATSFDLKMFKSELNLFLSDPNLSFE